MSQKWSLQCKIANIIIQISADDDACRQDMWKFLCLYEPVQDQAPHLHFHVYHQQGTYTFALSNPDGSWKALWQSHDAREVSAALEIHFYSRIVQYLDENIYSIHAAVLNIKQQAVMFVGESGAGKSSVCTAGLLAGAPYLSDEFTLLDSHGMVHPFPRPMQWEHPEHPAFDRENIQETGLISADFFDFPDSNGDTTRCHLWHPVNIERSPLPLTTIVLHQYSPQAKASELVAIPRHQALLSLPQHLHVQRGMAHDLPMLNQRISNDCRFYKLPFSNVFAAWNSIQEEVLRFS